MGKRIAKADFGGGSVYGAIMRMAVPATVAQLVNVLYSLVDRMYIGHLEGVGTDALTGLGVCMPVIMVITAFANLCGSGGAPLCSIARGAGDLRRAERLMAQSLVLLLSIGAVLTVSIKAAMKPLLYAFGASDATYGYAADYLGVYVSGSLFAMVSLGLNPYVNAQGFGKTGMLTTVIGALINLVLDPVFIFGLGLGIKGAAYATVTAQFCSCAWVLAFLCGKKGVLRLRPRNMRPEPRLIGEILSMGAVGFCMTMTSSVVQAVANVKLRAYGGDLYVGVMTVVNSTQQVLYLCISGIITGAQPVIGYNFGAEKYERVRAAIRIMTAAALAVSLASSALVLSFPDALVRIFNDDPPLVEAARPAMRIFYGCYAFMGFQAAGQCTFQALGRAKKAIFFSLLRKVVIVVPLTVLLPGWGLGVLGVFWAELISNVAGGLASYATMYFTEYRVLGKREETA